MWSRSHQQEAWAPICSHLISLILFPVTLLCGRVRAWVRVRDHPLSLILRSETFCLFFSLCLLSQSSLRFVCLPFHFSSLSHAHTQSLSHTPPLFVALLKDLVPSGHAHQPLALFLGGGNCVSSPGWESLGWRWVPLSQESNAQQLHCCQGLSAESLWGSLALDDSHLHT